MDFVGQIAIAGAGVMVFILAVAVFLTLLSGDKRPVLLERMLRTQSERVAWRAIAAGDRAFTAAVLRCVDCTQAAQCRAWLASGAQDGYQSFCPNAGYILRVKRLSA